MAGATWLAGVGCVEITPQKPVQMAGYYGDRVSTRTHDPLFAQALALSDGKTVVAMTEVDVVSVAAELVAEIREMAQKLCGVPGGRIMIAATHTHTGPHLEREPEYLAWMKPRVAEAVAAAVKDLAASELRFGRTEQREVSFIRRFRMKDGSVVTNPGLLNPNVAHPLGVVDPQLNTLRVVRNGKTRAVVVNFALHCDTVGGDHISACWPYFMAERMKEELGTDVEVIFTQGCAGDINHWNVFKGGHFKGFEEAKRIGRIVGEGALRALAAEETVAPGPVAAAQRVVALPIQPVSEEDYKAAKAEMARPYTSTADFTMERVLARKRVRAYEWPDKVWKLETQTLRAGSVAFVGVPGELFNALGRQIKAGSPLRHTSVVELANNGSGYIGEAFNYAEGGYEMTSSVVAPGSGEMVRDAALEALREVAGVK